MLGLKSNSETEVKCLDWSKIIKLKSNTDWIQSVFIWILIEVTIFLHD